MKTNSTLLRILKKIKQIHWMTPRSRKNHTLRRITFLQLKCLEIRISIDHLLSSLHRLKWNLITQTTQRRLLFRNVETLFMMKDHMKIQMQYFCLLINSKMDQSTKDSGKMAWDMEEENNSGKMDQSMKDTGRTTWLMEKADSFILMLMVRFIECFFEFSSWFRDNCVVTLCFFIQKKWLN